MYERFMQLKSNKHVDEIVPYDTEYDLLNMMGTLPINVRFVGSDYEGKSITGSHICEELGITIEYVDRMHTYSSTDLRERIFLDKMSRNDNQ